MAERQLRAVMWSWDDGLRPRQICGYPQDTFGSFERLYISHLGDEFEIFDKLVVRWPANAGPG